MWDGMVANEAMLGFLGVLLQGLLSIPAGYLHKFLDELPDWTVTPQQTTGMTTAAMALAGYAVAYKLGLPESYGILIGGGAGGMSGTAATVMGSVPTTKPASPGE